VAADVAARRVGVPRLGHHCDVGLALEHQAQRAADHRVIIGQDDGNLLGRCLPGFSHDP
jgi:hypothetical protein